MFSFCIFLRYINFPNCLVNYLVLLPLSSLRRTFSAGFLSGYAIRMSVVSIHLPCIAPDSSLILYYYYYYYCVYQCLAELIPWLQKLVKVFSVGEALLLYNFGNWPSQSPKLNIWLRKIQRMHNHKYANWNMCMYTNAPVGCPNCLNSFDL